MSTGNIDWGKLPFGYMKTDYNVRAYYKDGKWGKLEISSSEYFNIHIAATALHYGQQSFEGLKAYRGKDEKIRLFRWEENCKRMQSSSEGILMAKVPCDLYKEAIETVIKLNERYVPPYGSGASLYIRPLLIGSGPQVGVKPATEYMFMIFVTPVGPYFKEGFNPVDMLISRKYDRAAPNGTGHVKVGGNYAAGLQGMKDAHDNGYASILFLDSKEKKYIDECGPANFFGIKDNTYITPESKSILPSITNKSLFELAKHLGMKAERRPVEVEEIGTFEEVGACGTAAVISPIKRIYDIDNEKNYTYCTDGKPGPTTMKLYETLTGIQVGDLEDPFGWVEVLDI
ncbi:MAG: branched chain amino acid aminotransferase [Marinilabiliales bacterium]|nr:MAG: branched chain amino acid aminotransferase [Marinilabiliales bacterium]